MKIRYKHKNILKHVAYVLTQTHTHTDKLEKNSHFKLPPLKIKLPPVAPYRFKGKCF